ncbi:MAG: S41 family peptidase [bacterium]|jgi:tricorn protease
MRFCGAVLFTLCVLMAFAALGGSVEGYYRYPAIHDDFIIFTSEGDLYRVGIDGGTARRLTTHPDIEYRAAISPDGKTVAFSAHYEGPREVYTMPVEGGLPTRRTFTGEYEHVTGWTPDGKVIYTTRHFSTLPEWQLATIDLERGEHEVIPLAQANDGCFTPDGRMLYFTRLPFPGSHAKRYTGGAVQQIWRFSPGEGEAEPMTSGYPGTSKAPMWWDGRVYFASDRDGTMNIWSMDESGGDLRRHTHHSGWDVKTPALHAGRIVYQVGADLNVYDIASDTDRTVPIKLVSDFDQVRERWVTDPMEYLTSAHVSPGGDRIALVSRGRVFVAPVKQGRFVEATRKHGVRYRDARFMPDGDNLLFLSDETGEYEFWTAGADGLGEPDRITNDAKVYRFEGIPSPDGKYIAYTDKNHDLWVRNVSGSRVLKVASSMEGNIWDLTWSPDSRWLAFVEDPENWNSQIRVYSLDDSGITDLTTDRAQSYSPAWSPDGKWIYFLSDRHFESVTRSVWGTRQPEPFLDKETKIYMISLREGGRSPFRPDDEMMAAGGEENGDGEKDGNGGAKNGEDGGDGGEIRVEIDFAGIQTRLMEVPVPPGNYSGLSVTNKHLYWLERGMSPGPEGHLKAVEIKNEDIEVKTVLEDIRQYELSADLEKVMVRKGDGFYVFDASGGAPGDLGKTMVGLSGWEFPVDPREEWRAMLVDAWRMERDFFYDRNLHNVDWERQLERHLPLVERVNDRNELNDLIAHMISELSALHMFVWGGDIREGDEDISPASLGALLSRDDDAGGYRIEHIYRADPDYPDGLSPLARPDLGISEGDIIVSINGVEALSATHPGVLLKNRAGEQVLIKIRPEGSGSARSVIVEPITPAGARSLRYDDWEYSRRLMVEDLGGGDIGYVHLRAMGGANYTEWVKNFYPVFKRKGLIVDVRHNSGGNIDSWILEKLMRRAWFYWAPRLGNPYWNMQYAFRGHMVVICNEFTFSDGEAFAEGFRRLGLGAVVGMRTEGGEIWWSGNTYLADRGIATAAQSGVYGPEGEWLIEGHGVEPDMVVDNLPHRTFMGEDAQIEAAVSHLLKLIESDPRDIPPVPPYPDKSFDYE